ncbi:MAG: hypothetical protein A3G38_04385 [Omnitrophica WOR_2 bacterium RIFCSPLOWO2_12_FULL_51_8]|nr:MAG: hypothetical protein A3G38_04385 [Omnitrophica WOR_2 bacterium RIFCSPLOWO2_12_FULL_51_8]
MKLSKFLLLVIIVTAFSLLYVYQQTEVFRLAYAGQKQQAFFDDLLDKNSNLRYNIEKNASLARIGSKVSLCAEYEMPVGYRLVRVTPVKETAARETPFAVGERLLTRVFSIKSQAEARTINP